MKNSRATRRSASHTPGVVRYAVVGLGHIAQVAVLPAFRSAKNSSLVALVSSDDRKLRALQKKYRVPRIYRYEDYDECLRSGEIDAVYLALPNDQHLEYSVRAARAGIHVLCEKPLALSAPEGLAIVGAAQKYQVKLMTAYRLHFDPATLSALELVRSGRLGEPRYFSSTFSFQLADGDNIRTRRARGGGALNDIGIYCVNAARNLFAAEPLEVYAVSVKKRGDRRFREVDETTAVTMRFPKERVGSFTVSFGAANSGRFLLVGTKGSVTLDPAYEYAEPLSRTVTIGDRTEEKTFPHRDQFAGEIEAFSECILKNRKSEPDGNEGVADLRVLDAIHESIRTGQPVRLAPLRKTNRPRSDRVKRKPAVKKPRLVRTKPES